MTRHSPSTVVCALPLSRSDRQLAILTKLRIHALHDRALACASASRVTLDDLFHDPFATRARAAFADELRGLGWTESRIVPFLHLPFVEASPSARDARP